MDQQVLDKVEPKDRRPIPGHERWTASHIIVGDTIWGNVAQGTGQNESAHASKCTDCFELHQTKKGELRLSYHQSPVAMEVNQSKQGVSNSMRKLIINKPLYRR